MESFISQIQNLEASDIASILRQVQSGSLTVEEQQNDGYMPEMVPEIPEVVDSVTDLSFSTLSARHINLRRPGRNAAPLQSDVDIPVPLSKTEFQKQLFQARMMGAPRDIAERISQKTCLGSPTKVIKPNIGRSRSVSHNKAQQEEEETGYNRVHKEDDFTEYQEIDQGASSSRMHMDFSGNNSSYHSSTSHSDDNNPVNSQYRRRRSDKRSRSPLGQSQERRFSAENRPSWTERNQGSKRRGSAERSRHGSTEMSQQRSTERSPHTRTQRSPNRSKERNQQNSKERSPNRSREKNQHNSKERSPNRSRERNQLNSKDRSPNRSRERNQQNSKERSPLRSRKKSQQESMERSRLTERSPHQLKSTEEKRSTDRKSESSLKTASAKSELKTSSDKDNRTQDEKTNNQRESRKGNEDRHDDKIRGRNTTQNKSRPSSKRRSESEDGKRRKKRRKSETDSSQAPPSQSESDPNTSVEEITPPIIAEVPDPVVHSQVDKAPTECSFESLVTFKIPKKSSKPAKPTASPEDKKVPPTSPKADHKRGAAHESTDVVLQSWHGVLPKMSSASPSTKEGGSRTLSTMLDITGETTKANQNVLDSNWFDNMPAVRFILPDIPDVCTSLSREDVDEIQEKCNLDVNNSNKGGKILSSKFTHMKRRFARDKHKFVTKVASAREWKAYQVKLFNVLKMGPIYRQAEFPDEDSYCYLCQATVGESSKYMGHICGQEHQDNIARAWTSVGKLFYLKYLQKLADKYKDGATEEAKDKNKERRRAKNKHFCEMCIKLVKGPLKLKKHEKTQEHKDAVAAGGIRPKCVVCDIFFNTVKDMRHHVTRQYHKTNVKQKIEYGGLPAEYNDPELGENTSEEEDTNATDQKSSTSIETPDVMETSQEVVMETYEDVVMETSEDIVMETSEDIIMKTSEDIVMETQEGFHDETFKTASIELPRINAAGGIPPSEGNQAKPTAVVNDNRCGAYGEDKHTKSLESVQTTQQYYEPDLRLFFGRNIKHCLKFKNKKYNAARHNLKQGNGKHLRREQEKLSCLFSLKTISKRFDNPNYITELRKVMPGIVSTNFDIHDWMDVMKEYKHMLMDFPLVAVMEYEKLTRYFQENFLLSQMEAFECEISRDSSVKHQMALLQLVDVDKHISEYDAKNWFCYICMKEMTGYAKFYMDHVKGTKHITNVIRVGTDIGNMLLIKFIQTQHPELALRYYCSRCDDVCVGERGNHDKRSAKHKQHTIQEAELWDRDDAVKCTICDMKFYTNSQREAHLTSMRHSLTVSCQKGYELLPSNANDDDAEPSNIVEEDFMEDVNSRAELITKGQKQIDSIRGYFCIACNFFVNVIKDKANYTPEDVQLQHAERPEHLLNVKKYYQKLIESKNPEATHSKHVPSVQEKATKDSTSSSKTLHSKTNNNCAKDTETVNSENTKETCRSSKRTSSTEDNEGQISWMDFKLKRDKSRVKSTESSSSQKTNSMDSANDQTEKVKFDDDVKLKRCNLMLRKLSSDEINDYRQKDADLVSQKEKETFGETGMTSSDNDNDLFLSKTKEGSCRNKVSRTSTVTLSSDEDVSSKRKEGSSQKMKARSSTVTLSSDEEDDLVLSKRKETQNLQTKAETSIITLQSDEETGMDSNEWVVSSATGAYEEEDSGNSTSEMEDNSRISHKSKSSKRKDGKSNKSGSS